MARARDTGGERLMLLLLATTLAAPVLVLAAALGTQFGLWPPEVGWSRLTWGVAQPLSWLGLLAGLAALGLSFARFAQRWRFGLLAALVAVSVSGAFFAQTLKQAGAGGTPADVSSDAAEPPAFSAAVSAQLARSDGRDLGGPSACPGLHTVPKQIAPGVAAWALEQAGFRARGAAAFRADGVREGFWFGFTHYAAVRIRPGQTDVRVAALFPAADDGEACRLAVRLVQALETPAA